jgi:DNA polymerase-3 subunit delta
VADASTAPPSARAYLFWGEDSLSRDELVRNFRSRMLARPGGELNLSEFHAPQLNARDVIDACNTLPFAGDRRLVLVYHLFGWRPPTSSRRRAGDAAADSPNPLRVERQAFLAYLPYLAPQTTLVLVEAGLTPAQRNEIVKQLPRERADIRSFPSPQGIELERWLARRARRYGGELGPQVARTLREHGPGGLEGLDREVAKLIAYAGSEPVSMVDVTELLTDAEMIIFDLLDAIAEGRSADALAVTHRLFRQGQRPEELTPQVIALYRRLLICRLALEERLDAAQVERTHGVKLIDKLKAQARRASVAQLETALERLLVFDRKLKLGEVEPQSGLELLVAELAELASPGKAVSPRT